MKTKFKQWWSTISPISTKKNYLSPQLIEHTNRRPRHMMLNTQKRRPRHMMLKIRLYVLVCPILLNVVNQAFMCQNNVFYIFQQEHENIEYKWTIFTEIKTCMTKGNVTRILKHPTGNNYVSPFDCFSLIFSSASSASSQRSLSGPQLFVFPDRSIIFGMWVHDHKVVCRIP